MIAVVDPGEEKEKKKEEMTDGRKAGRARNQNHPHHHLPLSSRSGSATGMKD